MAKKDIRFIDDPKAKVLKCSSCIHRSDEPADPFVRCKAFPDGIPKEKMRAPAEKTCAGFYRYAKRSSNQK